MKSGQKVKSGQIGVNIAQTASIKLDQVIICPNSYEKLTKSRSSWIQLENCSEPLI